jgi:hypothetical protein
VRLFTVWLNRVAFDQSQAYEKEEEMIVTQKIEMKR